MAQDAPADTAGPSSPPPPMPEGWLPQWEGVQRKWYYVQRATGKSQWEIPTEPVVLTPSTTPTSIGNGPSQAPPSRPSTNSPRVTAARNTLAERIEAAADNARVSSSLDSQLNEQQAGNPDLGTARPQGWLLSHGCYHQGQGYGQHLPSDQIFHGSGQSFTGHPNPHSAAFYTDHAHPAQPQQFPHTQLGPIWDTGSSATKGVPNTLRGEHFQDPFGGLSLEPQLSQQLQQTTSHNLRGYASTGSPSASQHPGFAGPFPPSQSQWQSDQHAPFLNNASQLPPAHFGASGLPQPSLGSHSTPQVTGHLPGDFSGQGFGASRDLTSANAQPEIHSHAARGHGMSRSHSQQSAVLQHGAVQSDAIGHSPYGYTPQSSNPQGQYTGAHINPSQSANGFNSAVFPSATESQGSARYYQNPLVQASANQYLHHRTGNHGGKLNQSSQAFGQQDHWKNAGSRASRSAASDPQFVSGPWASSTPPTSGPPAPSHQG